ncbi:MAG: ComEC/Rec2 family competence protein [Sulfurospirillaceae bacterium]|nr:ComEC/Rec2 family competence protein [Sulfurospirillaceae bacterium]MDD3463258.1 ComEC/Rec2 family competence protein [Sulfurospirillaceae bacterium]
MLATLPLFATKKEQFIAFCVAISLFCLSLGYEYFKYQRFTQESLHVDFATVLNHYQKQKKNGRLYDVYKLKVESGEVFHTTSWTHKDIGVGARVKVKYKVEKLDFVDYLKGFFAVSFYIFEPDDTVKNLRQKLYGWVEKQHSDSGMSELYNALFFAKSISKENRDNVQKWGISHLVAISGFHLGVLSFLLYFLLNPIYRFFQDRYFPYRNRTLDISAVVFTTLFAYMYIIDFTPSFLRAFIMSLVGFYLVSKSVKILSFSNLLITIFIALIISPKLVFSISFWLSVSGVYFIFLFLYHFGDKNKWFIFFVLNVWVYLLMMPIVHFIFSVFTPLQLFSPILSILFVLFYPLSMLLHVVGFGDVLDEFLKTFLAYNSSVYSLSVSMEFLSLYIVLCLASIKWRFLSYVCLIFACGTLFFIQ